MRSYGLHHIHKRKRATQKLAPYPHTDKWMNHFDKFLLVVAIVNPLTAIPQIYQIFVTKNAFGVSLLTWFFSAVLSVPWLIYGIIHKEKSHIISFTLWVILSSVIVFEIVAYA